MTTKIRRAGLSVAITMLMVMGCKNQEDLIQPKSKARTQSPTEDQSTGKQYPSKRVDVYPLTWEGVDYMPMPTGYTQIPVPWASGAGTQYSPDLKYDYRTANGWVLLYNTFNTDPLTQEEKKYFMLYNKYTGVARLYYFVPSGTSLITSENIINTLSITGSHASSSPILNFSGQNLVDVTQNAQFASEMQRFQASTGTWYVLQHELAYDANTSSQSQSAFSFQWDMRARSVSSIVLSGVSQGSLTGTISVPGTNLSVSPSISTGSGAITINGPSDKSALSGLGTAIIDGIEDALTDGASGIVGNVLGAILGINSSTSASMVNLKMNSTISLTGNSTTTALLNSQSFAISGYDQTNTSGFSPAYNSPLGVFYISARPTVNEDITVTNQYNSSCQEIPARRYYTWTVDPNSFSISYNPSVTSIASISNVLVELVLENRNIPLTGGHVETVGANEYYVGTSISLDHQEINGGTASIVYGVRVSFDVNPSDSSPKYRLAKTFKMNLSSNENPVFVPCTGGGGQEDN